MAAEATASSFADRSVLTLTRDSKWKAMRFLVKENWRLFCDKKRVEKEMQNFSQEL